MIRKGKESFFDQDIWLRKMQVVGTNSQGPNHVTEPLQNSQGSNTSSQGSTGSNGHIRNILDLMGSSQGREEIKNEIENFSATLRSDQPLALSDGEKSQPSSQPLAHRQLHQVKFKSKLIKIK